MRNKSGMTANTNPELIVISDGLVVMSRETS